MTEAARCTRLSQCFSIKATSTLASHTAAISAGTLVPRGTKRDRKSTRLNSSHLVISYAVFCLKKKKMKPHFASTPRHVPYCILFDTQSRYVTWRVVTE